jgi:hypothetical protein
MSLKVAGSFLVICEFGVGAIVKATKGLIAVTPEVDCDQTAMGLPDVMSAILLKRGRLVEISEMPLLPLRG